MNLFNNLPARLFWDVDLNDLNAENHAPWITVRVFERGTLEDIGNFTAIMAEIKLLKCSQTHQPLKKVICTWLHCFINYNPPNFYVTNNISFTPAFSCIG